MGRRGAGNRKEQEGIGREVRRGKVGKGGGMGRCNEDGSGEEGVGGGQGTGREWEGKVSRGIGGEMENGEEIGREQGNFR